MTAVAFAVVGFGLLAAHQVGDHWVQTHHQAMVKGVPGWSGRWACARHVGTYTAVTAGTVLLLWWLLDLRITLTGFVAGQMISAVSHYWADRRTTLEWLAGKLSWIGREFYRLGAPRQTVVAWTEDDRPVRLSPAGNRNLSVPWDNPSLGTGAYALDQSWHWCWLCVAALITAVA